MTSPSRMFGWLFGSVLAALALGTPTAASAQAWPARPVTIVSPYPAGGITDQLSRIVADELGRSLGQPVLVENKPGAGGAIAMTAVGRARADGYTLVMGGSAVSTVIPALRTVGYDPIRDFEPVGYVAALPIVLVASPSVPATTVDALVAHARAHAGSLNCGHHGPGTGTHLACVMFNRKIGATIPDVAYKGAPDVNQDLLADRVQLYFGTLPTELALIRGGRLRAFGIASDQRAGAAPEIPTLVEQGLSGLNLDSWNALYAPAGTPPAVLATLRTEVARVLQVPDVRRRIEVTGSVMRPISAEQLRALTASELDAYRRLVADTGIRVE